MQSLTLSESALRPHLLPQRHRFTLFSFNSLSKNRRSSHLSFGYPCLIFSRYSRKWRKNQVDESHFLPLVFKNEDDSLNDFPKSLTSRESMPAKDNTHVSDEVVASAISHGGLLKFALLFGYLTFQGSQQALAGTDLGLQLNPYLGDLGDISTGFASAFLLIFFSELGDKTFFIAALLAARNSAATVFVGTFGALAAMTVISVALGRTFHYVDEILPFRLGETDLPVDDIAAVCLLVYFGISTLIDASSSDGLKAEDEQKEAEIAVSEFAGNGAGILAAASTIISTFLLVFVAEWGDKSFFSTIALAAASSPLGVIGGSLAGHGVATLIAVLGGSLLGTFLSEKVIAYTGGVLFLVFAAITVFEIVS
ncbi:GDT1-like protein 1 chloroplastic [Euphorbia peplus]|nr:GDT1-like protein 1 chloroplastic [Euphorbia peplus]